MACGEPHMTFKFSDRACGFFSRVQKTAYALQWGFRVLCPLRFHPGVGGTPHMKGVGMLVRNFDFNP